MTLSTSWFFTSQYFIPHRLMLLARMIERETTRDLQSMSNLTAAEWRALAFLCTTGPSSAAQICLAFEVDRAEVSRAVARLVEAKLIERSKRRDQENRLILTPTASGEKLYQRIRAKRRKYFDLILRDLEPAERDTFDAMLSKIAHRVDEQRSAQQEAAEAQTAVARRTQARKATSRAAQS